TYCASWFAVKLLRASQGTRPTPKDRLGEVRAVRKEIEKLPPVDRALTLLWLREQTGGDALIGEKDLVQACKKLLGPDRLLDILRKRPLTDDPDLHPGRDEFRTARMIRFVLKDADQLLRPKDADAVLACEADYHGR